MVGTLTGQAPDGSHFFRSDNIFFPVDVLFVDVAKKIHTLFNNIDIITIVAFPQTWKY